MQSASAALIDALVLVGDSNQAEATPSTLCKASKAAACGTDVDTAARRFGFTAQSTRLIRSGGTALFPIGGPTRTLYTCGQICSACSADTQLGAGRLRVAD